VSGPGIVHATLVALHMSASGSLARPGGNTTGFTAFEYSISGKWLDLLKALAPGLKRVAVLRDPSAAASIGQFAVIQSVASSSGIELSAIDSRDANEIERGVATLGREPNGGLIVTAPGSAVTHRKVIISQATRHSLPNIYPFRYYPLSGGLASYGLIRSMGSPVRPRMSIGSSRVRSRATSRSRRRPNTNWLSILRPPRRWASKYRRRCSTPPTR